MSAAGPARAEKRRLNPANLRTLLSAALVGVWLTSAHAQVAPSRAAERFIETGAAHAIARCDVLKGLCGRQVLAVTSAGIIAPNDQRMLRKTLAAPGLVIEATFTPVEMPIRYDIAEVFVQSNAWPLLLDLKIGSSRERVVQELGQPNGAVHQQPCIEYHLPRTESTAAFCFRDNRLQSVRWVHWRD